MIETAAGPGRPGAIAILSHSYYEEDPRVRRQAESLAAAGWRVDVFGLQRPGDPRRSRLAGVEIHHLGVQRHQGAGPATYLAEYLAFFVRAAFALSGAAIRRRFDVVQVATLPDWLVFAALPLKLAGVPVLLDLHEAMPDFFATRFPGLARPWSRGLIRAAERASLAASTRAITVNSALRDRLVALGARADRIDVVPNSVSLARFDPARYPARAFMVDRQLRLIYAGALTPTYELDVVLRALALVRARRPNLELRLDLYGRGDAETSLRTLAAELGLADAVDFHGRIPIEDVPAAIAASDIGLAPTRLDAFTRSSLSTKIFEYAAMAKPVVASRLPMIERELPPDAVALYEPGDVEALGDRVLEIVDAAGTRSDRVEALRSWVAGRSWDADAVRYVELIEQMVEGRRAPRFRRP
ncbi:MAG TPA: glycosyltransferase family 4 protein [Candidatus Limnocylindrales bacterium]|nr:glycosyltransferase family 4 protein [Candidatus Limnocylindrales bacterium]